VVPKGDILATFSKDLFLPSLLDRLINEDSVNQQINEVRHTIRQAQQDLSNLSSNQEGIDAEKKRDRQYQLEQQLMGLQAQHNTLIASVSAKHDIKACVKRDLEWLFNAIQYVPNEGLDELPESARSVINFGIPDFSGKTISGLDMVQIERLLLQAIINFEPRIIRKTLTVKVISDQKKKEHNVFVFEIEGEISANPQPLRLHLRTELELESSQVTIFDVH